MFEKKSTPYATFQSAADVLGGEVAKGEKKQEWKDFYGLELKPLLGYLVCLEFVISLKQNFSFTI